MGNLAPLTSTMQSIEILCSTSRNICIAIQLGTFCMTLICAWRRKFIHSQSLIILTFYRAEMHTQNMITLGHHFVTGVGNIGGLYIGGFFGSMSQLTWISECSTFFVNFGQILAWHEKTESNAYLVNGISMLVSFFIFRVLFYTYMIFWGVIPFDFVDSEANWKLYP